jgi:3-deoxy-manno-octulosonate cytidylyltransferase (CMP-KDO synthetase)
VDRVVIATDSDEVARSAAGFGAEVFRSRKKHLSGTDRAAEAASEYKTKIVINIQGDNLGLKPAVLDQVLKAMVSHRSIEIATVASPIRTDEELFNPNVVKVAASSDGHAIWFSRYPLPFLQRPAPGTRSGQYRFLRHVGIYFFRPGAIRAYANWKSSPLEKAESLEQLRILEHGKRIRLFVRDVQSVSVDSPNDLGKLNSLKL